MCSHRIFVVRTPLGLPTTAQENPATISASIICLTDDHYPAFIGLDVDVHEARLSPARTRLLGLTSRAYTGGMHELSLLNGVVSKVDEVAQGRSVRAVGLIVGKRSGVLVDALEASWPIAQAGTVCDGASLDIEEVEATVWCPTCDSEQEIDEYFALTCPVCGTPTADLRRGQEFSLAWIDVE